MSDEHRTRRRFLATATAGVLLGVAGCSSRPDDPPTATTTPGKTVPGTGAPEPLSGSETPRTPPRTEAATDTRDAAERGTEPETGTPTGDGTDGPGYKQDHWHGRLFFEVNGELVDFDRPKYYLETIGADRPETVYFHFHEDEEAHGPNEWSNEKRIITFQRALDLLPGIGYERKSGEHVITHEGTTYDARESGTSVSIKEGDGEIDPTGHRVTHGDVYYVQITTDDPKRSAKPAHGGADLGTLLFDMNNVRVDFSRETFLGPSAATDAFHFHDDGNPYMWYKDGTVTLEEALNALPHVGYARRSGDHVVTYDDEARPAYSRTYDGNGSEHDITVKQRTTPIDPTSYDLQAGDVIWVYVTSDAIPENEH